MQPDPQLAEADGLSPKTIKQIKLAVIAFIVVLLGVLVFYIASKLMAAKTASRWDELARIQERYESDLAQDPLLADPSGAYQERRERYVLQLETFLATTAAEESDALEPHVHWLIAKVTTDQILTMRGNLEPAKRAALYDRAIKHLKTLRDAFPDFQTNWLGFAPEGAGEPTLTRLFLATLESNRAWEERYFPKDVPPSADTTIVLRTNRGDMRIGLYKEQAPELAALFLDRVRRGVYDGTAFFGKNEQGTKEDPILFALRAGHPATQNAQPFDIEQHSTFADAETFEPLMPEPSRYMISMDRGVVVGWHDLTSPYDGAATFGVVTGRSPRLDHEYTALGRLLDDASLETADRIFEGPTWGEATDGEPPADLPTLRDFLRAPVTIVKALAYENGTLLDADGKAVTTKASVEASEKSLSSLEADAYRTEAPAPPTVPEAPETPETPETPDAPGEQSEDE